MKNFNYLSLIIIGVIVLSGCTNKSKDLVVNSFDECVENGGLIMESFPPQCSINDQVFTQLISYDEINELETPDSNLNIENPASVFCVDNGGILEIRDGIEGQVGVCIFPNGSECDEWEYMRGECIPKPDEEI
jgi:putative hemolysin